MIGRLFFIALALQLSSLVFPRELIAQVGDIQPREHPRLILWDQELPRFRGGFQGDVYRSVVHAEILEECGRLLSAPQVERVTVGIRLLSQSREAMLRIFYLSYAWRVGGDPRYLKRAKEELMAIANFSDWNPSHFLDVAEMTIAAAIGYDWLYHELSPQQRAHIEEAILTKGLRPSQDERYNWWLAADHNWNQVCNTGMLIGALAIYEKQEELAQEIIERSARSISRPMQEYGPDGAYPEGYMYWGYGTTFNVLFLDCLERAMGRAYDFSGSTGFLKTANFMQHMTGIRGDSFNYSDSDLGAVLQPAMFWFAGKLGDGSLLWSERDHMAALRANVREDNRLLPLALIWGNGIDLASIDPPKERIWAGHGKTPVALMRSSWSDSLAIYVGFKGGSPSTNHGHMDVGSFVMEGNGVRWSMDYGKEDYQALEAKKLNIWKFDQDSQRWGVFKYTNFAHSTLSVDDALQDVRGHAPLMRFSQSSDGPRARMDLSSVYPALARLQREIKLSGSSGVCVTDAYTGGEQKHLLRWGMLTDAHINVISKDTVELIKQGKKLLISLDGQKGQWKTWPAEPMDGGAPAFILGFEREIGQGEQGSMVVNFTFPR